MERRPQHLQSAAAGPMATLRGWTDHDWEQPAAPACEVVRSTEAGPVRASFGGRPYTPEAHRTFVCGSGRSMGLRSRTKTRSGHSWSVGAAG